MTVLDPAIELLLKDPSALIPTIVQDHLSHEVLMLAYMNRESLAITLESGRATYWSRSRNKLWVKGATSGNFQEVHSLSLDCDGDALLINVNQTGAPCHTGKATCFYTSIDMSSR